MLKDPGNVLGCGKANSNPTVQVCDASKDEQRIYCLAHKVNKKPTERSLVFKYK